MATVSLKAHDGFTYTLTDKPVPGVTATPFINAQAAEQFLQKAKPVQPANWVEACVSLLPAAPGKPKPTAGDAVKQLGQALAAKKLFVFKAASASGATSGTGGGSKGAGKAGVKTFRPPEEIPLSAADRGVSSGPRTEEKPSPLDHTEAGRTGGRAEGAAAIECTATNGCPISMVSGEELLSLVDAEIPGPVPFQWRRVYRSGHSHDIGLGHGWTHTACERLHEDVDAVELKNDEGRRLRFKRPIIRQCSRLVNEQLELEALSHDTYVLRQEGQPPKIFTRLGTSSSFRLTQIRHPAYRSHADADADTDSRGFAYNLHYDERDALVRVSSNWGKTLLFIRNERGRLTRLMLRDDASGQSRAIAEYDYDKSGDLIAHRDAAGRGESYHYGNHILLQRTLATGFSYYYEWDQLNNQARCLHTWGDNGIYDYRFTWDPDNNTSTATDSRGYTSTYVYNEFGLITEETDNEGGLHRYTYEKGLRTSYTDPEGNTTRYSYDSDHHLIGEIDALDQRQTRYYFQGRLATSTSKDGAVWRRDYNARGLLERVTAPDGQVTRYRYNKLGLPTQQVDGQGRTTRYEWDAAAQLAALVTPDGHKQTFRYNPWGQVVQMDLWLASRQHGGTTRYHYNTSGELTKIQCPTGESVDITYNANGQIERVSDRRGRVTRYEYDGLSQVVRKVDPEGHILAYGYDTERNLVKLVNENGDAYRFIYDGNERLIEEIGFDGRRQTYGYNRAGHLVAHTDAGMVETAFQRDVLGRMVTKSSRSLTDSELPMESSRYLYDPAGRLKETYNGTQYLTFSYDACGRLIKEHHCDLNEQRQLVSRSAKDIHLQRAASGQLQKLHLPDGEVIQYQYDAFGRLEQVAFNGTEITRIERDALGIERGRQQGEIVTHSDYDPMGRLVRQRAQHRQHKDPVIDRQYQYDPFGNLSQFKDGSWEVRYVYDMVDRLKRTEGDLTEHFVFDPAGNLLGQQKSTAGNTGKGNRLVLQGDRKFEYDARGNLIKESRGKGGKLVTRYEYNLSNQLVKVVKGAQTTEYKYDPLGRRTEKHDGFGTTHYLWAGDHLAREARNNIQKTYVYEPESFKPLAMVQDGEIYHYHLDHLGTPRELTNQQGNIVWKAHYNTYGSLALKEVEAVENNLRFQGQYFDEETGLHYNRHRYYNPNTGQFTTQDPIGLLGGLNNYQYAPNPTGWIDPLGLKCKENTWNEFQKQHKGKFSNVSEASKAYGELKQQQSPWPIGFSPIEATLLPGAEFNMAYEPGQDIKWIGGFGTVDEIPNKSYVRNKLAVKEEWKEDLDRVVTFRVTKPLPVLLGPVGPQVDGKSNSYLPGGGSQIAMQVDPRKRGDYLEVVSVTPLKE